MKLKGGIAVIKEITIHQISHDWINSIQRDCFRGYHSSVAVRPLSRRRFNSGGHYWHQHLSVQETVQLVHGSSPSLHQGQFIVRVMKMWPGAIDKAISANREDGAYGCQQWPWPGQECHNIPGTLVPRATKAMAVILSFRPIVQPKWEAMSPIKAVSKPTPKIEIINVG